jgi:dTDP-4-amino-4,6-dideoxygalactose transaminase
MNAVQRLESEFAARFGFVGGVDTGFGRSALRLALETSGAGGGEVLVPDFICAQVVEAVRQAGARPVFFRVGRDLSVSPESFSVPITPSTRAAIVAHYYGRTTENIAELSGICRSRGIFLVEDCALALGVEGAGGFADAAVFSFTKSDWCYGGGILAAKSQQLLEQARAFRDAHFVEDPLLTWRYGSLSRADFNANRPSLAHTAAQDGRRLQESFGLAQENFYDLGRFDARMTPLAARRALIQLEQLAEVEEKRRSILSSLLDTSGVAALLFRERRASDSAAFLLLRCPKGDADLWQEKAEAAGVTLRRCWPAYQGFLPGQKGGVPDWLAGRLLVLEIHPDLDTEEGTRIVGCFKSLAGLAGTKT